MQLASLKGREHEARQLAIFTMVSGGDRLAWLQRFGSMMGSQIHRLYRDAEASRDVED